MGKKVIGTLLIIVTIFLFIVYPFLNKEEAVIVNEDTKLENRLNDILKNYKTETEKYGEGYNQSLEVLSEFFYYLNTKDYSSAYSMIDDTQKEEFDYSKDKMIKNHSFESDYRKTFTVDLFKELHKGLYYTAVTVLDFTADSITDNLNGGTTYSKEYIINTKTKKISENGLIDNQKVNIKSKENGISINVTEINHHSNGTSYKLKVLNNNFKRKITINEISALRNGEKFIGTVNSSMPISLDTRSSIEITIFFEYMNIPNKLIFDIDLYKANLLDQLGSFFSRNTPQFNFEDNIFQEITF